MTALETLQKYGLKTDVKSIKERMRIDVYPQLVPLVPRCYDDGDGSRTAILEKAREAEIDMLRAADLALLCELAEKGERVNAWKEKELEAIENAWELINHKLPENNAEIQLVRFAVRVAREVTKSYDIITESEGESK